MGDIMETALRDGPLEKTVPLGVPLNTTLDENEKHILIIEDIARGASPEVNVFHSTARMVPESKLSKVLQSTNKTLPTDWKKL